MSVTIPPETWRAAVLGYWEGLTLQAAKQGITSGVKDTGNRAAVTGGKQMDAMQQAMAELWHSDPDIRLEVRTSTKEDEEKAKKRKKKLPEDEKRLPAYFRATKNWDLLVLYRGALVAAMEFKSQRGPSFGNNFNNRTEEALGLAADSQMAAERGLYGRLKPWFGFVMLVERAPKSLRPVAVPQEMAFPADKIFDGASYIDRYRIFFERMVAEGNYNAAVLLTAEAGSGDYVEPSVKLSLANMQAEIKSRITFIKELPEEHFDRLVKPTPNLLDGIEGPDAAWPRESAHLLGTARQSHRRSDWREDDAY